MAGMAAVPGRQKVADEIRAGVEAWNEGRIADLQELFAGDAEVDISAILPEAGAIRGKWPLLRFWRDLRTAWSGLRVEVIAVLDVGDDRYILDERLRGTDPETGREVDQRLAYVFTLNPNGRIRRARVFRSAKAALRAAAAEKDDRALFRAPPPPPWAEGAGSRSEPGRGLPP
jgi:ketosteroid isomerase-like protein